MSALLVHLIGSEGPNQVFRGHRQDSHGSLMVAKNRIERGSLPYYRIDIQSFSDVFTNLIQPIMSDIKLVLFDMDGVLIDAREWHYDALNKALELFGYTITRQEHENFYDGLPTKVKLEHLSKEK